MMIVVFVLEFSIHIIARIANCPEEGCLFFPQKTAVQLMPMVHPLINCFVPWKKRFIFLNCHVSSSKFFSLYKNFYFNEKLLCKLA